MSRNVIKDINSIQVRDRILVSIMIVLTVFVFLKSTMMYFKNISNQYNHVESTLEQYADSIKESIDKYFDYNFRILEYIASKEEVYNMDWEEQYEYLVGDSNYLDFEHLFIVDLDRKGYYINSKEIKDQSNEPFANDVLTNRRFVTKPFNIMENNKSISTLSVSIYRGNIKVGALCGAIDLSEMIKKVRIKDKYKDEVAYIINSNGQYIAHKDMKKVYENKNIFEDLKSKNEVELRNILLSDRKMIKNIEINEVENLLYSIPIEYTDWNLVISRQIDYLLEDRAKFKFINIITLIGFSLVVFSGYILMRKSLRNLKLAHTDTLTKINNREVYVRTMNRLEKKFNLTITIMYLDLNDFKILNDTYGHTIGDEVLVEFSNMLKKTFIIDSMVARTGGDEFIVILINKSTEEIEKKIFEVKELIEIYNCGSNYNLSMSYGYATREKGEKKSLKDVCEEADENMYKYKKYKRNLRE